MIRCLVLVVLCIASHATGQSKATIESKRQSLRAIYSIPSEWPRIDAEFFDTSPITHDGIPRGTLVAKDAGFEIHQIRWRTASRLTWEGLYVTPTGENHSPTAPPAMVLLPGIGETPEDILGLNTRLSGRHQMGLRFATAGFRLIIPTALSESTREALAPQQLVFAEIESTIAAARWLKQENLASSVTLAGWGHGGRIAMIATALDPPIDHAFISGAFSGGRDPTSTLSDAEIASLIFPRPCLIEHSDLPEPKPFESIEAEFKRIGDHLGVLGTPANFLIHHAKQGARADYPSVAAFLQIAGIEKTVDRLPPMALLIDERGPDFDPSVREQRILASIRQSLAAEKNAEMLKP